MTKSSRTPLPRSLHSAALWRQFSFGLVTAGAFLGIAGTWASTVEITGAVIAPGQFVVDSNVKKVQHPSGGIVGELKVKEGDAVRAGDLLIRLDETVLRANVQVILKQLDELRVRGARLECERSVCTRVTFPTEITARATEPELAQLISSEHALFQARKSARMTLQDRLGLRIGQLLSEMEGLKLQQKARGEQTVVSREEMSGLQALKQQRLVQMPRYNNMERDLIGLEAQMGQLGTSIAQVQGKITETQLQIINIDEDLRSEVSKELREIQPKAAELEEKRVAAEDQLRRSEIRAPQSGTVHQLSVHTIGGVIATGEPIMLIVPANEPFRLEVRIAPQDIDQLQIGQPAIVRVHAFNRRTTPELAGQIERISADISKDTQTGMPYYAARLVLTDTELDKLSGLKLVAGMQADAFIRTGERTFLDYLTKPITEQIARAFKDR